MSSTNTSIKIDPALKKESQALFESFGLSLSTAVNIFLRQQAIPFRIGAPAPNAETMKAIDDARNGIGLSKGFSSVEKLMEDLDADD